jgi:hypothetical protein
MTMTIRAPRSMRKMAIVGWVTTEIAADAERNKAEIAAIPIRAAKIKAMIKGPARSCEPAALGASVAIGARAGNVARASVVMTGSRLGR